MGSRYTGYPHCPDAGAAAIVIYVRSRYGPIGEGRESIAALFLRDPLLH
jgi:hypothetical protein